ncbi:MAG: oxygen-dependent coproporphyrinogen oxidase [Candidatus Sphingomonas colombiensis]|nr:oxygen-dependent coproporphyrinogen oxidase [Sphingomonas sp.]WEK41782.1 MAG: oxygen-dependent coproporphyrinogen oxidase [Sphingomonas sp.]
MQPLDQQQSTARAWFEELRDLICAEFEAIEREAGSDARFDYISWDRTDPSGAPGGGGVRGVMKGRVFEKVGVNVSTVGGALEGDFAKTIHGAADDPSFFATGISLVAHMANPHVPAVHMNTRFLATTKRWFGGGADLNPPLPIVEDTADFHAVLKAACDTHDAGHYPRFKQWADDYFYIPHRKVHRGVGGIFYDHLEGDFASRFRLHPGCRARLPRGVFPRIVRRRMGLPFTEAELAAQREWRGRYAEFNLVHDRGTLFGLKTGGNIDAILMSLPPLATWS